MRVYPFFRWYDLWVGAYWARDSKTLFVCPVPMFGLRIHFGPKPVRVSQGVVVDVDKATQSARLSELQSKLEAEIAEVLKKSKITLG